MNIIALNILYDLQALLKKDPCVQLPDRIMYLRNLGVFHPVQSLVVDSAFEAIKAVYHLALQSVQVSEEQKFFRGQIEDCSLVYFLRVTKNTLISSNQLFQ